MASMGISKAYLDSSYLLSIIKDEKEKIEVEHMLYKLQNRAFDVFVPHVVLGEICGVIFYKYQLDQDRREKMIKLADIIADNKIQWNKIKPTEHRAFKIMVELSEKDGELDATDIMMVAHVLADPDSKFLFTIDKKLLGNEAIINLAKTLESDGKRNTDLKIRDSF